MPGAGTSLLRGLGSGVRQAGASEDIRMLEGDWLQGEERSSVGGPGAGRGRVEAGEEGRSVRTEVPTKS